MLLLGAALPIKDFWVAKIDRNLSKVNGTASKVIFALHSGKVKIKT